MKRKPHVTRAAARIVARSSIHAAPQQLDDQARNTGPERTFVMQEQHVFQEQTAARLASLEAAVFGPAKNDALAVDTTDQEKA